jgi:hypothetical protein
MATAMASAGATGTESPLENPDVRRDLKREKNTRGRFAEKAKQSGAQVHEMGQMGAKRIGSLAIGIGVVGIVLNQMSGLDIVGNSTGVVNVSNIFSVAGDGLNLLVIGVIIAAAAVLLNLWSGF